MVKVIRANAIGGDDDLPVALISIDGRHADAGVCVEPGGDEPVVPKVGEHLIEGCSVKRAVLLVGQRPIEGTDRLFRSALTSSRALYGYAYALLPHFWKCVV